MLRYFLLGAGAGAALFTLGLLDNAFAAASAPVSAPAPTFPTALTQGDLANVREVCVLAQRSERLTLEQATGVGTYCQGLLVRLGQALSAPAKGAEAPANAKATENGPTGQEQTEQKP